MDGKIAVQFNNFKVTRYAYQKLYYCTKCSRYTVLDNNVCPGCGWKKLVSIDKQFDTTLKRRFQIDIIVLLILFLTGIMLSRNLNEIYIMVAAGIVLCGLFLLLKSIFEKSECTTLMMSFFNDHNDNIFNGLKMDAEAAWVKMNGGDFKCAYEDFREIGVLLQNDSIRLSKLICLSRFILRSDMALELESLVMTDYNAILINYINEVLRLNMGLVKKNVIEYVIANESSILSEQDGFQILGNIAGAMIRSSQNVLLYKEFIIRYLNAMKKERLERLYRLLKQGHPDELDELYSLVSKRV